MPSRAYISEWDRVAAADVTISWAAPRPSKNLHASVCVFLSGLSMRLVTIRAQLAKLAKIGRCASAAQQRSSSKFRVFENKIGNSGANV